MKTRYLAITVAEVQCAVCGGTVAAGLAGHSDDCPPQPICWACLARSDPKLMNILMLVEGMRMVSLCMDPDGDRERLAKEARELVRFIRTCLPEKVA